MPTDGAFFRRTAPATTSVVAESFDVETQSKLQRMRARDGLSLIRIRRWWLHLRGTRPRKWVFVGISVICLLFYQRASKSTRRQNTTNESTCNFRQRPLMVQLLGRTNITQLTLKDTPERFIEDRRNHYWIDGGVEWHYPLSKRKQGCVALGKWQDEHHPSCLVVHEIDLLQKQFRLLGTGYYRSGFMFQEYDGTKRALKMKRYKSKLDFNERLWDKHRRDALALEQMSNSPYVMNIYGYCMNSVIVDYSDKRSLYHVFDSELSKEKLLKVAHDVACAVRDAHNFDERERATIVHADISPDQFLLVDGIYKLNDFNRGKFLSWDPERDEQCGISYELNGGNWRAPEEYKYEMETEKIDVWSLGNTLYYLLTRREPFYEYKEDEVPDLVKEGKVPSIKDASILNSTHIFDKTLLKVMKMCWKYDPKKRPSSRQVASMLQEALERLKSNT